MIELIHRYHSQLDWSNLAELSHWAIEQGTVIQTIPAPTFEELPRAEWIAKAFEALNLTQIHLDDVANVYGCLIGTESHLPGIMISAHTDTVFDRDTNLTLKYDADMIYGPGLGDNSIGVAGMLAVAKYFQDHQLQPKRTLWFVATTGEEGLGDLRGMKAAYRRIHSQIDAVINLEGLSLGHVYNAGIAVKRLKISAVTGGGHSWLHYGRASALHSISRLAAKIASIKPPVSPRTTYNIGRIEGGTTVNAIAANAALWLDMRSEELTTLDALENQVRAYIREIQNDDPDVSYSIEVVGDRPAGYIPQEHALVQLALEALQIIGIKGIIESGSTDGNVPLSHHKPTVTIGITRGGNAHRLDEYIEKSPVPDGLKQLILLVVSAVNREVSFG